MRCYNEQTSTVMLPMIARWCPSRVSRAIFRISSSRLPRNCWHAACSISMLPPCTLTWHGHKQQSINTAAQSRNINHAAEFCSLQAHSVEQSTICPAWQQPINKHICSTAENLFRVYNLVKIMKCAKCQQPAVCSLTSARKSWLQMT